MDLLAHMAFFTTAVDTGSFAKAARRLGVTASAVSRRIASLERELHVPLLTRSTRSLSLTDDGRAFHVRCVRILEEVREAREATARTNATPSGVLRVDAPIAWGRFVLGPQLPAFLARYPDLQLEMTLRDQFVDPVAEGIDVVIRMGLLVDSTLVARRLGETRIVVGAAPSYLHAYGTPKTPRDLARHVCLGFLRDGRPNPWHFLSGDGTNAIEIAGSFHANDIDLLQTMALAGRGLLAAFDFVVADAFASGALVRVLAEHPSPTRVIHAVYAKNRHLLPKVGAFLDFVAGLFRPSRSSARRTDRR